MSKRRRLRRSLAVLILLVLVLGAGWTGLWYVVAGRLADHVLAWEQQQRAAGWAISHGAPTRTGWPMAAGIALPGIAVSGGGRYLPGGIAWQAGSLTVALDIRHPNDLFLGIAGRQSVRIGGGPPLPFQAARMIGRIALLPGERPGLMQLHATNLLAALAAGGGPPEALSIADIAAAMQADGAADANGNALLAAATLSGIGLPPRLIPGLGGTVQTAAFDAALSGPAATAAAWQQAGGSLTLRALHLVDGGLTLDGQGRFQLDPALRPSGSLSLAATGLGAAIDRMVHAGVLSRPAALAITAMLGLMMRPPDPAMLQAPLTLLRGVVSLGAIPLVRLPL
jgi:hypothetical protein